MHVTVQLCSPIASHSFECGGMDFSVTPCYTEADLALADITLWNRYTAIVLGRQAFRGR